VYRLARQSAAETVDLLHVENPEPEEAKDTKTAEDKEQIAPPDGATNNRPDVTEESGQDVTDANTTGTRDVTDKIPDKSKKANKLVFDFDSEGSDDDLFNFAANKKSGGGAAMSNKMAEKSSSKHLFDDDDDDVDDFLASFLSKK